MYIVKNERALDKFIGEEVFIMGTEDVSNTFDLIQVFDDIDECQAKIDEMTAQEKNDHILLYGRLSSADVLPGDLRGKDAYIIVADKDDDYGIVCASNMVSSEGLAKAVQEYLDPNPTDVLQPDIDDIFVLYGMELDLDPNDKVDMHDIDEEIMQECGKLTAEIENVRSYLEKI